MAFPFKLPLIADGATGTELQKLGMPLGVCSEKWILENPNAAIEIQKKYIAAGSDAIYAPTFGCNAPTLKKHGITVSVGDYCQRLVDVSRAAVRASGRDGILIGGDISPCGLLMEPYGDYEFDEIFDVFREQAYSLENAGVDFFAVETQISLDEAKAAVAAVRAVSNKPLFVSFTCGETGRSFFGERLGDVAAELAGFGDNTNAIGNDENAIGENAADSNADAIGNNNAVCDNEDAACKNTNTPGADITLGIDAFGINCCGDLELMLSVFREIREKTALPLIAKPNAGLPRMTDGVPVYKMTAAEIAQYVRRFYDAGVRVFGGCCGTTDAHISAIAKELSGL